MRAYKAKAGAESLKPNIGTRGNSGCSSTWELKYERQNPVGCEEAWQHLNDLRPTDIFENQCGKNQIHRFEFWRSAIEIVRHRDKGFESFRVAASAYVQIFRINIEGYDSLDRLQLRAFQPVSAGHSKNGN